MAVTNGTYKTIYLTRYQNLIKRCADADIVQDSVSIFDTIKSSTTPRETKKLLDLLFNLLEWCKRRNIVQKETYNPYIAYKQDVSSKSKQKATAHIREQKLDSQDSDYRGFNPEEAEVITESFRNRGQTPKLYYRILKFLFLTGCRPSEAVGLQWEDVSEDCTTITFRHAYCQHAQELKGGKNARYEGKEQRTFPCGAKLRNLLLEMKEDTKNSANYVFLTSHNKPVNWLSLVHCWAGIHNKFNKTDGVVEKLAREKKIRFYLAVLSASPYAATCLWL